MRRAAVCLALGVAGLCSVPGEAGAWSEGTHAYIADHIGKSGFRNYQEMYGAMAPDLFNLVQFQYWDDEQLSQCARVYTHGFIPAPGGPAEDFLEVWDNARWGAARNLAFGYVSHNDVWGADVAAHWYGYTNSDPNLGWVMQKAHVLIAEFDSMGVWSALGIPLEPSSNPWVFQPAELLTQYLVMRAGDVIIKRNDPEIGAKVALAALFRAPAFNDLLADTVWCVPEALVRQTELDFRRQTISLGLLLLQSEQQYLDTMAQQTAALAPAFMAAYGKTLPSGGEQIVADLSRDGLELAVALIEDDYMDEVQAIIDDVEVQMADRGVEYWF